MFSIQMSIQGCFLSEAKVALATRKGFFSSMYQNVTLCLGFEFHDFGTHRTFWLTIFKNDWLNNLQKYFKFFYLLFQKNYNTYFLTMFTTKMSFQRRFLITGIIALTASIRFFSSMYKDVTCNHLFCFHDSGTQRTFDLTTRKSNWLNNLQHFKKFQNIYFLL